MNKKALAGIAAVVIVLTGIMAYRQINKAHQLNQLQNSINEILQNEETTLDELQNVEALYDKSPEEMKQNVSNIEEVKYREAKLLAKAKEYDLAYQKYDEIIEYGNSVNLQNELCYNWARSLQQNNEFDKAVAVAKKIPKEKAKMLENYYSS